MYSSAVKIIRKKCGYDIYYIGCEEERVAKQHSYSVPKPGGNFSVPDNIFVSFPFLSQFAEKKVISVRIVSSLNESNLLDRNISSMAVKQELENLSKCFNEYGKDTSMEVLNQYNRFNKHSIVCYNVGLHYDIFHKDSASFENKIVFRCPNFDDNNGPWELSRGGGEYSNEFCYALLDWGVVRNRRRENAINHGIIQPHEHVTQQRLENYFANNPNDVQMANDLAWDLANNRYL